MNESCHIINKYFFYQAFVCSLCPVQSYQHLVTLRKIMRPHSLPAIGIATLGLFFAIPLALPVQAEPQSSNRFFCGKSRNPVTGDETPTTIARTQRGNVLMIHWKSTVFVNSLNDFTPESRCLEISRRFQAFYSQGNLSYLTTRYF